MHCCIDFLYDLIPSSTMGASSSSSSLTEEEKQTKELEARITVDLPLLKDAYSRFSTDNVVYVPKLEQYFGMKPGRIKDLPESLGRVLPHLGPSIVSLVFKVEKTPELSWIEFLRGFDSLQQTGRSSRLKLLLVLFFELLKRAQIPSSFHLGSEGYENLEGSITKQEFEDFLGFCWLLMHYGKLKEELTMISVKFLVDGAFKNSEPEGVSPETLSSWMMNTIPNISSALVDYVRTCFTMTSTSGTIESAGFSGQLTPGRAWALGLSQKDYIGKLLISAFFENEVSLLYRSSLHGKGMNRFWAHVEGYKGPTLLLFSVLPPEEGATPAFPYVFGVVMPEGLKNTSSFYGSNDTCIVAFEPEFVILRTIGREKNYVYTHKVVAGVGYTSRPVPDGLGFGGDIGKERVWLSDDFSTVTFRHYATDKTFQSGFLVPHQGYTPLDAQLLEVELWGLGGKDSEEKMLQFQQRENLFAEQRRKVDLKAFGNWQDSPEKMMMDMLSNPGRPEREERCGPS